LGKYIKTTCLLVACMTVSLTVFLSTALAAPASTSIPQKPAYTAACGQASIGHARCLALISTQAPTQSGATSGAIPFAHSTGSGVPYGPSALHSAYNLPTTTAGAQTIAIVDAFDDPNAESDLATYRSGFGIPACTTANGCFRKVNQTGGTTPPASDVGWGVEISLDLDMASAICFNCHILLVEANSATLNDLGASVNEAAALGANEISNSYGTNEFSGEGSFCNSFYSHSGVAITVSSGDQGPIVEFPATCGNVIGVGGTTLQTNGTETAWNTSRTEGSGGGCSRQISKPSWEVSSVTGCSRRAVADVSAVADPATGVFVFDTFGEGGGLQVGGTSASSPIIAGVFALAGGVAGQANPPSVIWSHRTSGCLFTVGGRTYAFQTGLGSPNGTGCF